MNSSKSTERILKIFKILSAGMIRIISEDKFLFNKFHCDENFISTIQWTDETFSDPIEKTLDYRRVHFFISLQINSNE